MTRRKSKGTSRQSNVAAQKAFAAATVLMATFAIVSHAQTKPPLTPDEPLWDTGTFSILGFDPQTGEVGGAVQSRVFSVGNGVLWADADVGVAATQAIVDVSYGRQALDLLRKGLKPETIITRILAADKDPLPERWTKQGRQFAVMNLKGESRRTRGQRPQRGPATRPENSRQRRETFSRDRRSSTT